MVLPSESVELESPSLISWLCPLGILLGILFTTFGLRTITFGSDLTVVVIVDVGFEEAGVLLAGGGGGVATLIERLPEELLVVGGMISTPLSCL